MKSKTKKQKIITAIIVFLVILVSAGVSVVAANWRRPLSTGLELPTYSLSDEAVFMPELQTEEVEDQEEGEPQNSSMDALVGIEIAPTMTPLPTDQPTPVPLCGGPAAMTILGVGVDNFDEEYRYGLADVIRIARVDFVTPKVSVIAIPRDVWVQIPHISDHYGITAGKINQAYFYGTESMGYYDGPGGGSGLLALTLAKNFGLYVDRYGAVNMYTLERMIDAVGGIDIYLPKDVDGTLQGMGYFSAGQRHFTGEEAIRYSRIRFQDSDLKRIDRQTEVLYALQDKILSLSVWPRIPKIIASFKDSLVTDLSPKDITALTCLLPHITRDNLVYARLPDQLLTPKSQYDSHREVTTWTWAADFNAIRRLMVYFQAGAWP